MTHGKEGAAVEVNPRQERRIGPVNEVLESHGLSGAFTARELGNLDLGEFEVLEAREVIDCGDGLSLVHLPAQFTKDSIGEDGEPKQGARGDFWTVFASKHRATNSDIFVPFVTGAPGNFDFPTDSTPTSPELDEVNRVLAQHELKPLPLTTNAPTERVVGISRLITENERFFTVVVFKVQDASGEIHERPIVYNAKSNSGIDGTVMSVILQRPSHGMEPRLLLGKSYRPNIGGSLLEAPRGFFDPRLGGTREGFKAKFTDIPTVKRAIEELHDETGLRSADVLREIGRMKQDPTFEASTPSALSVLTRTGEFGPQDLEVSEKLRLEFLSLGDYFAAIPDIIDPFTLAAVSKDLARRGVLTLSDTALAAQNENERMAFLRRYQFQHGEFGTEAIRGSLENGLPQDFSGGRLAVNSGIARIQPELYQGNISWNDFKRNASTVDPGSIRLMYPYEVLREIGDSRSSMDIVSMAAAIKALHSRGYLEIDLSALPKTKR